MKKLIIFTCVSLMLIGTACTHRLTDFTVISTKNVPFGTHAATFKKADKRVKAKDTAHTILFIPFGMPNMKEAIDKAIEMYPDAIGLVDGVVKSSGWTCLLYGQNSYIVEGTPIYEVAEIEEATKRPQQASDIYQNSASQNQNTVSPKSQQEADAFTVLFYHDVKRGETLDTIAETYKVSIGDIIKWNQLNTSTLTPGTKLRIMLK